MEQDNRNAVEAMAKLGIHVGDTVYIPNFERAEIFTVQVKSIEYGVHETPCAFAQDTNGEHVFYFYDADVGKVAFLNHTEAETACFGDEESRFHFYWPNCIYVENGKARYMSSYEVCASLKEAKETISKWREVFDVACSWCEDRGLDNRETVGFVCVEPYVDAFGNKLRRMMDAVQRS